MSTGSGLRRQGRRTVAALVSLVIALALGQCAQAGTTVKCSAGLWTIENAALKVSVEPDKGLVSVLDKVGKYRWQQPGAWGASPTRPFRDVQLLPGRTDGIGLRTSVTCWQPDGWQEAIVSLQVPDGKRELIVGTDMPDRGVKQNPTSLDPFILDAADGVLVAADYCDGHLYPTDIASFVGASVGAPNLSWFSTSRLDMPWVGLCDLKTGSGYAAIVDTPDDGIVTCTPYAVAGRQLRAPRVLWVASMGQFSYARRLIYSFVPRGGYVALAKTYRSYVKEQGGLVTFSEKVRHNPNIAKLFGAPSVWGALSLDMARQAKAAGVTRMLMQGSRWPGHWGPAATSDSIKAINSLGYLVGEYDNYTDMYRGKVIGGLTVNPAEPDDVAVDAAGQPVKGWWDGNQYMYKRCASLYPSAIEQVLTSILGSYPFTARFLDVVTGQDLGECYSPKHPLSRSGWRQASMDQLSVARKHGLVVGAEHGVWWAVPYADYFEGMMSGNVYSWPAGYLVHPKAKDDSVPMAPGEKLAKWADYETWSIGAANRVPLWELVFHDCVATTWYWGDSNDWLLEAAPEVTDRKIAFNVLYGTIPMMWNTPGCSWEKDRDAFLRIYRNVCKFNQVIADKELTAHQFVTADRLVQRTTFSDGIEALANFGEKPYTADSAGRRHVLPQNGFVVHGPRIDETRELAGGKVVTRIRLDDYRFSDETGVGISVQRIGASSLRVNVFGVCSDIRIVPLDLRPNWRFARTHAYRLDQFGDRTGDAPWTRAGEDSISLGDCTGPAAYDVVCD